MSSKKLPLRHDVGSTVAPGDRLGIASRGKVALLAGRGTHVRQGHVYASVLGTLRAAAAHHGGDDGGDGGDGGDGVERWIISVDSERSTRGKQRNAPSSSSSSSYADNATAICPQVGALVLGRVTRVVRPTHATVDVVAIVPEEDDSKGQEKGNGGGVGGEPSRRPLVIPLHEPFSGTLRQNEVRPNSSLEVRIEECVRPGDVILSRIHADGERDFILTTAEAELGVVQAVCESSGIAMRAVSWKEMQCPVSLAREGRKVAKPRQARAGA